MILVLVVQERNISSVVADSVMGFVLCTGLIFPR